MIWWHHVLKTEDPPRKVGVPLTLGPEETRIRLPSSGNRFYPGLLLLQTEELVKRTLSKERDEA